MIRPFLSAAAWMIAGAGIASGAGLAERFPAGTVLVAEWSGMQAQKEKLAKTALGEFFADAEVRKFTEGELPKVWGQIRDLASTGLPPGLLDMNLSALAALRDRPVALAVIGLDVTEAGLPAPQVALAVGAGAGPERQALARWVRFLEGAAFRSAPPRTVKEKAGGVKQLDLNGVPLTWGFGNDVFAVTIGARAADVFFGPAPGERASLTDSASYRRIAKSVKYDGAMLSFYLDSDPIFRDWLPKLKPMLGGRAGEVEKWLAENAGLGLAGVRSTGATLAVEDRGFRERSLIVYGDNAEPAMRPIGDEDLRLVPADAGFFSITRFDPVAGYDRLLATAVRIAEINRAKDQFENTLAGLQANLGVDFRRDIVGALGDTVIFHGGPTQFPLLGGFTVRVSVKDPAKLRAALERMSGGLNAFFDQAFGAARGFRPKLGTVDDAGTKIHFLPFGFISPAAAVTDKHLVFTLFPQSTGDAVRRGADAKAKSILDDPAYRKAVGDLRGAVQLSYADPAGGDWVWGIGGLVARTAAGMLPEVQIDFDSATLPPAGLWRSRTFPTVGFTRIEGKATYTEGYAPTPFGDAAPMLVAIAGLTAAGGGVAYFQAERQKAERRMMEEQRFLDRNAEPKRDFRKDDFKRDDSPREFRKDDFPRKDEPKR